MEGLFVWWLVGAVSAFGVERFAEWRASREFQMCMDPITRGGAVFCAAIGIAGPFVTGGALIALIVNGFVAAVEWCACGEWARKPLIRR